MAGKPVNATPSREARWAPWRVAGARARWWRWLVARTRLFTTALAVTALALFGGLAVLVQLGLTMAFDLAVTHAIQAVSFPFIAVLMAGVSILGFQPFALLLVLATVLLLWQVRLRLEAALALAGGGGGMIAEGLKLVLLRPRPSAEQVRVAAELVGHSFPSGHVLMYVGFFGFLGYLAYVRLRPSWLRSLALGLCGGLVGLVGVSRVYLGQHWPTDVLASYLLGIAYLILLVRVYLWRARACLTARAGR